MASKNFFAGIVIAIFVFTSILSLPENLFAAGYVWTERQPAGDTDSFWRAASDSDGSNLFVGISFGRIYTTLNGGANWTEDSQQGTRI